MKHKSFGLMVDLKQKVDPSYIQFSDVSDEILLENKPKFGFPPQRHEIINIGSGIQ